MTETPTITLADQIACVARESKIRENVYPQWVRQQRIKHDVADLELARMAAVLETLTALREIACMAQSSRPGAGRRIEAIYAWIAEEPDGGEGVCSAQIGEVHFPLVGADIDRAKSLRPHAELVRQATGYPVRLVRYGRREDLEELP
jgi:hypothetical protein